MLVSCQISLQLQHIITTPLSICPPSFVLSLLALQLFDQYMLATLMGGEQEEEDQGVESGGGLEMGLEKVYPSPLLSHVEVSTNPIAFYDTLRRVHSALGTRFMIPVIGGKELDLHHLYVQVTQRGGLEKVISEKRWRDVIATFNFPPTTTSASFVLRKYYLGLLHHYEQVYFFRAQGPLVAPSAILQTKTPPSKLQLNSDQSDPTMRKKRAYPPRPSKVVPAPSHIILGHEQVSTNDAPRLPAPAENTPAATNVNCVAGSSVAAAQILESIKTGVPANAINGDEFVAPTTVGSKTANDANGIACSYSAASAPTSGESTPTEADDIRKATTSGPPSLTPTLRESASTGDNLRVSGTIDGKFEHGYFATVKIGTQILHGVLYHVSPLAEAYSTLHQASHPPPPEPTPATVLSPSNAITPYIPQTRSVHRRRKYKKRAPDHPKPNRSSYNFFFAEKHRKLKTECPNQEREYSKMIGVAWNQLTDEERSVYDDYGKRDKDRYIRELQEYKERMRLVQPRGLLKVNGVVRGTEVAREVPNSMEAEMAEAAS